MREYTLPPRETAVPGLKRHTSALLELRGWDDDLSASVPCPPPGGATTGDGTACHMCHTSTKFSPQDIVKSSKSVTYFRKGAKINTVSSMKPPKPSPDAIRGEITGLSNKSRSRLVFDALNCPLAWRYMITLTYPHDPATPAMGLKSFLQQLRRLEGDAFLWVREYTDRKRLHYHVALADCGLAERLALEPTEERGKKQRVVCTGPTARKVGKAWMRIIQREGGYDSATMERVKRFTAGGIIEPFRSPDAAGRYLAKEFGSKKQKTPPEGLRGGKWWGRSKSVEPVAWRTFRMDLTEQGARYSRIPDLEWARKMGDVWGI